MQPIEHFLTLQKRCYISLSGQNHILNLSHLGSQVSSCHHDAICCPYYLIKVLQAVKRLQLGNQLNAWRLLTAAAAS
jgi:hypothetical protein